MTLEQFLNIIECKEKDIVSYSGEKALEIVRRNGYALRVVDKSVFKDAEEEITHNWS